MEEKKTYRIKKNDIVVVIAGKEKGKTGKVLRMIPKKDRVLVERVNMVKRHTKPGMASRQGGIIEKEAGVHISNVKLMCGKCNEATRVGFRVLEDGRKVRFCKKCNEMIDS